MEKPKSHNGKFIKRFIPARAVFVIMGFFGFNLVYGYKVVLSMSIIAMTNKVLPPTNNQTSECFDSSNLEIEAFLGEKFDWDSKIKNQLLGSFFYGYVVTQIPAGILASKYGGKWIFGISLLVAAILSLVSPFAAKVDYRLLMAIRVGQGLAEGVVQPCINTLVAQWMPKMERTRGNAIISTGSMIGTVITLPLTALLGTSHFMGSWEASFYILGMAGIVWFVLWTFLVYESPETHPFIDQKEVDYILANEGGRKSKPNLSIPYRQIFSSVPVYALMWTHFGENWGFLTILSLMPTYMNNVLHMHIKENIIISGMPYLAQALVGWTSSWICDKMRQNGRYNITTLRKVNSFFAYIPSAICLALIPTAGCDSTQSAILFILAVALNGFKYSGFHTTHIDMAPEHSGTLMGITNSFGNIPGILVPIVAQHFTIKGQTVQNWSYIFYIASGIFVVTAFVFCTFATSSEQSWGRNTTKQVDKDTKEAILL